MKTPVNLHRLCTRRCRKGADCRYAGWHTHHLTWVGAWRHAGESPFRFWAVMAWVMCILAVTNVAQGIARHDWFPIVIAAVEVALAYVYSRWDRKGRRKATRR